MPASSSSFGPNCWLWSGKKNERYAFSVWSAQIVSEAQKKKTQCCTFPSGCFLLADISFTILGICLLLVKKKWVMVGLRKMEQDTSILQNLQTYSETSAMCLCLSLTQSMSSSFSRACFSEPSLDLYLATNITTLLASAMWEFYTFKNYYMMP